MDDFAKYLYLPRVKNAQVILDAIQDGVARLTWKQDTFAYADSYDAATGRYRGLEAGRRANVQLNSESAVVKPEIASEQMAREYAASAATPHGTDEATAAAARPAVAGLSGSVAGISGATTQPSPSKSALRRFHGSATLNSTRLSRDAEVVDRGCRRDPNEAGAQAKNRFAT